MQQKESYLFLKELKKFNGKHWKAPQYVITDKDYYHILKMMHENYLFNKHSSNKLYAYYIKFVPNCRYMLA